MSHAAPNRADWLGLAAAPTFAVMAAIGGLGGRPAEMLCSAANPSPLSGMVPMYLLMSVFHASPWLKLVRARRAGPPSAPQGCWPTTAWWRSR